ncbi:MAG: hypothetical protein WCN95_03905 [bacterium]
MADFSKFMRENLYQLKQADQLRPVPNPTFANPVFEKAKLKVLIVRLSPFRDVDRSTPHLFLADAARRAEPKSYVDMCFLPVLRDRQFLIGAGVPLLMGMESFRTVDEFDVVLVSNSYALELINLPYLLANSGIPLDAGKREAKWPPVILGGSNTMCAQAIIREDGESFADAVFFGEGEHQVAALLRMVRNGKRGDKRKLLASAAKKIKGLWVAGSGMAVKTTKYIVPVPSGKDIPVDYPLLNSDEAGTAKIQVAYGCPAFCSFCFEGYDRKPYREIPAADIVKKARELKQAQGCSSLDLYGFSVSEHTEFVSMMVELSHLFDSVTLKSQRMEALWDCPQVLQAEVVGEKRTFTLGIEGISTRQRAKLNKSLAIGTINGVLARVVKAPVREIKLFFVLTGSENEADLTEFRELCMHLGRLRQLQQSGLRTMFSFGFLVRLPGTPMRHERLLLDRSEWRPLMEEVAAVCRENGHEVREAVSWTEYCVSQVMAIGGHWLYEPIAAMAVEGCCYDNRLDNRWWEWLRKWMVDKGEWNSKFLGEKGPDYKFPLPFVKSGISDDFLYSMYLRSKNADDTGHCLGRPAKRGHCLVCGACSDSRQKQSILTHSTKSPLNKSQLESFQELIDKKRRLRPTHAVFRLSSCFRDVKPAWAGAFAFKKLLAVLPELADNLLAVEEQLFSISDNLLRFGIGGGETVFALKAWDSDRLIRALSKPVAAKCSDVSFVSLAEGFKPGVFRSAIVDVELCVTSPAEAGNRLSAFLRNAHLPIGLRREGEGYRLEIQGKGGKKEVLTGGNYSVTDKMFKAHLAIGPKFELKSFVHEMIGAECSIDDKIEISGLVL